MRAAAERMKTMRHHRRGSGFRELRLVVPDARDANVRARVAEAVARLDPQKEAEALRFVESVSEFDNSAS